MSLRITENHKEEIKREMNKRLETALEEIGIKAEGYAARLCPVDTGLLRNSITSAVGGKETSIKNYTADKEKTKGKGKASGSYSGIATAQASPYVVLGTNVEYAPSIELGSSKNRVAKPFLKPALTDHVGQYRRMLKSELSHE